MIWENLLSDTDRQYVELQSGRLYNPASENFTTKTLIPARKSACRLIFLRPNLREKKIQHIPLPPGSPNDFLYNGISLS
jgi:hypothetical protein